MKRIALMLGLIVGSSLAGCQKTGAAKASYVPSERDAAAITANAILPRYGGLLANIVSWIGVTKIDTRPCNTTRDTTFTLNNVTGNDISFSCRSDLSFRKDCALQTYNILEKGRCTYNGYNYVIDDQVSGKITMSVISTSPNIVISGNLERSGLQRKKAIGTTPFNSRIQMDSISLQVDPATKKVSGGRSVFAFYTKSSKPAYSGKIRFRGANKAEIIMNGSQKIYAFSW